MNHGRSSARTTEELALDLANATAVIAALLCDDPSREVARAAARAWLVAAGREERGGGQEAAGRSSGLVAHTSDEAVISAAQVPAAH
jgi:hypothetical protein